MHVITVVVDNKRALEAYTKALSQLNEAWPRLVENGEKEELRRKKEKEKNEQDSKEQEERYNKRFNELKEHYEEKLVKYEKDLKLYQSLIGQWTGAGRPKEPWPEHLYLGIGYRFVGDSEPQRRIVSDYEPIRQRLVERVNMASVAIEPFAMSESEVKSMFAWENGIKIRELLDDPVIYSMRFPLTGNSTHYLPWF